MKQLRVLDIPLTMLRLYTDIFTISEDTSCMLLVTCNRGAVADTYYLDDSVPPEDVSDLLVNRMIHERQIVGDFHGGSLLRAQILQGMPRTV